VSDNRLKVNVYFYQRVFILLAEPVEDPCNNFIKIVYQFLVKTPYGIAELYPKVLAELLG